MRPTIRSLFEPHYKQNLYANPKRTAKSSFANYHRPPVKWFKKFQNYFLCLLNFAVLSLIIVKSCSELRSDGSRAPRRFRPPGRSDSWNAAALPDPETSTQTCVCRGNRGITQGNPTRRRLGGIFNGQKRGRVIQNFSRGTGKQ